MITLKKVSFAGRRMKHYFLPALIVVGIAIAGSYYLAFSKADNVTAGSFEAETMTMQPYSVTSTKTVATKLEAETFPATTKSHIITNSAASGQKVLQMNGRAATSAGITTTTASTTLHAKAYSSTCGGYANIVVSIDNVQVMNQLTTASNTDYSLPVSVAAGKHMITIKFPNDAYRGGVCDRNLSVDYVSLNHTSTVTSSRLPGKIDNVSTASAGKVLRLNANATASVLVTTTAAASSMTVTAKGEACKGDPNMNILIDGVSKLNTAVSSTGYMPYTATVALAAGKHTIAVNFDNNFYTSPSCNRNLLVDKIVFSAAVKPPTPVNPPAPPTTTPPIGAGNPSTSDETGLLQAGMYTGPYEYSVYGDRMKADGFNHIRVAGNFSDATMTKAANNGASVLYTISIGHREDYASDDAYIQKYLARVTEFLGRYGPHGSFFTDNPSVPYKPVTEVGIMNEPNFGYMMQNGTSIDKAKLYAKVLVAAYPHVKAHWPDVTVVGFDAGGASAAAPGFIKAVHEQDPAVAHSYDVVGFQPYTNPVAPDQTKVEPWGSWTIASNYNSIRQTMQKYGTASKPVWITEIGWSISKADGGHFDVAATTLNQELQAAYTVRLQLLAMQLGIARTYHMYVTDADGFNGGFYSGDISRPETGATTYLRSITVGSTKSEMLSDGQAGRPFVQRITTPHGSVIAAWTQNPGTSRFTIITPGRSGIISDMMGTKNGNYSGDTFEVNLSNTPTYLIPASKK